jgi:hypothetical protein
MRRCKHPEWVEVGRTYTRPPETVKLGHGSQELIERITFGVTNIELRCSTCGDRKVVTVTGKVDRAC